MEFLIMPEDFFNISPRTGNLQSKQDLKTKFTNQFVCTPWSGYKHCYLIQIILSYNNHSSVHSQMVQVFLCNTNNSIYVHS